MQTPVPFEPLFGQLAYDSSDQVIYVALHQYGLAASSDDGATWSQVTGLPSVPIFSVDYQPEANTLYVGTSAGLYKLSGNDVFLPVIFKNSP